MEVIGMGLMGITLGVQSYWDIRYKQIPILVTGLLGAVGIVLSVLRERPLTDLLMALTPGLVCLLIGKITEEAIGYGDGFLLCAMGAIVSRETLFAVGLMAVIRQYWIETSAWNWQKNMPLPEAGLCFWNSTRAWKF